METIGTAHTTSEYAEGSILSKLSREDEYARDLLRRSGIGFDVVDLSKGLGPKLRGRLQGVKLTPTLIDGKEPPRMFVGIAEISEYLRTRK